MPGVDTMVTRVSIYCVSWIDQAPLPKVGFWLFAGAATSWVKRVIMGLVATSNPAPGLKIPSIGVFMRSKQYRAVQSCVIELGPVARIAEPILDPGYTPPFDKNRIETSLRVFAPSALEFHAGEKSAISGILLARLHPSSSIVLKSGDTVVASGLLKFRAGASTDQVGIEKANSPVHVPWVWSEFALVSNQSGYRLVCRGALFPSHAWYVDGKRVASTIQGLVTASGQDPILTTGRPASAIQSDATTDKNTGSVGRHADTIGAATQIDVPLTLT